jgi:hypothetical protein
MLEALRSSHRAGSIPAHGGDWVNYPCVDGYSGGPPYRTSWTLCTRPHSALISHPFKLSFALVALLDPSILSLRSIALLQQSSLVFRQTFSQILFQYKEVKQHMSAMKRVFSAPQVSKEMSEGTVTFPDKEESKGLAVEFK